MVVHAAGCDGDSNLEPLTCAVRLSGGWSQDGDEDSERPEVLQQRQEVGVAQDMGGLCAQGQGQRACRLGYRERHPRAAATHTVLCFALVAVLSLLLPGLARSRDIV